MADVIELCEPSAPSEGTGDTNIKSNVSSSSISQSRVGGAFDNTLLRELAMERERRNLAQPSPVQQPQQLRPNQFQNNERSESGDAQTYDGSRGPIGGHLVPAAAATGRSAYLLPDRKRQRTGKEEMQPPAHCVDMTGDSDDEDGSLTLARRLQDEENSRSNSTAGGSGAEGIDADSMLARQLQEEEQAAFPPAGSGGSSSRVDFGEADSAALAQQLQQQEMAMAGGLRAMILAEAPGSSKWIDMVLAEENQRRVTVEGPSGLAAKLQVVNHSGGIQARYQTGGRPWADNAPCVTVDNAGVSKVLLDLEAPSPDVACAANIILLRGLCAWRQHILETKLERRPTPAAGTEGRWKGGNICTSLTCFLGRKGGVICLVAACPVAISTITAFAAIFPKDGKKRPGKGLACFIALCVAMFFNWPLHTEEALATLQILVSKLSDKRKTTDPRTPQGLIWRAIMAGQHVDTRLRSVVLSRAHLP
jgi:hypothetical protein